MILKRDRGQNDATLFVTGRDVEREQQLALSFDVTTALWTLMGNAEELSCTRARQEILDLLCEHGLDGMSARKIAEALEKNYHTTRSLLRKMEDAGEVRHADGHYLAVTVESRHNSQWPPLHGIDHKEQQEKQQPTDSAASDDSDDADDADDISHDSFTERCSCSEGTDVYQVQESIRAREDLDEKHQEHNQREHVDILHNQRHHRHHCHHRNQMYEPTSAEGFQGASTDTEDHTAREEQTEAFLRRNRCPHHPYAQLVRFDPAGQAWGDKMDCWDCFVRRFDGG